MVMDRDPLSLKLVKEIDYSSKTKSNAERDRMSI